MLPVTVTAALMATLTGVQAAPQPLAANGKSAYVIVLPAEATAPERTAANELQAHLKTATGAALPIVTPAQARSAKGRIWLGQSAQVRRLAAGVNWAGLGADGIVMRTVGRDLVLTGGRPRGVLYAVYEFLHRVAGVRWWDETAVTVPRHARLALPSLNVTYVPRIVCREPHFYLPNHNGTWAARNRANGHFNRIDPALGGNMSILGWCHTFYALIPPATYFAQHPEWFSEIGGKRTADGGQLCLANEAMRRELTQNALEWIRKEPEAGFISISQNDWQGACQCAQCKAVEVEEGSPSGPLIRFVNAVAADIEKEFPAFRVETLAYQYTRKAPKVTRPRRNVTVRLCSIECDYGLPLDAPRNQAFLQDLEAWSAIAPQLFIWTYIASFGDYYHPNPCLPVYEPNIRAFADHHAVGVFMQGDSYNAASCFVRLRSWVIARLLWDPRQDAEKLTDEFLRGYYGPAAPHMRRYLTLVEAAYARRTSGEWMTPQDVLEGFGIFRDAARAVAGNAALKARVERERLPLDYLWATRHGRLLRTARAAGGPLPGPDTVAGAVAALRAKVLASESLYRAEGQPAAPWLDAWLEQQRSAPADPPEQLGRLPRDAWTDLQEPAMRLYNAGDWVTLVDDPAASNKKAARLSTHHTQWAVQLPLDDVDPGAYRLYAAVRVEAGAQEAAAFTAGVYDTHGSSNVLTREVKAGEAKGPGYQLLDLGRVELTASMYAWFAPAANPGQVQAVFIDRLFVVKE